MLAQRTIPEFSVDGRKLAELLSKAEIGEVVHYSTLTAEIKRDVQRGGRSALNAARKQLLHENQMVFATVTNTGLKRLSDAEKVATGEQATKRIHRQAVRSVKIMQAVHDFAGLTPQLQAKHNSYLSAYGVIAEVTSAKNRRQIEAAVAITPRVLELEETLKAFRTGAK